jgi:hypothetical protein
LAHKKSLGAERLDIYGAMMLFFCAIPFRGQIKGSVELELVTTAEIGN